MDEEQRRELQRIREEQRRLSEQLFGLNRRIITLERASTAPVAGPAVAPSSALPVPAITPAPAPVESPRTPPPLPRQPSPPPVAESASFAEAPLVNRSVPPPLPSQAPVDNPSPPMPEKTQPAVSEKAKADGQTLEMQIGSVWMVRIAIFMALTTLVFGGTWLYQNVVPHLGPAAKVGLMYLAAGTLAGFGAILERSQRARESVSLLNYARVVLAGGLAGIYYVTYAAHYFPNLRVIESPLLAGALLLGWTAFMTWLADRRNSEVLATFSILLAYYTSATSEVASFTLFANLGLTAAAVFLVRRRRWTAFSFACLAATFGSYAYWRYGGWFLGDTPVLTAYQSNVWIKGTFLACYWSLFTYSAFFDAQQTLEAPKHKATFISLNNGAFFALVGLLVRANYPGEFWKWSLLFGAVLLVLAELGRQLPRRLDTRTVESYHFEGISLVTLGFILYFSGWQLSLILAVESATILAAAGRRESRLFLGVAFAVAGLSFLLSLQQLFFDARDRHLLIIGLSSGAVLVFNAWQSQRLRERTAPTEGQEPKSFHQVLVVGSSYFSFLGLAIWLVLLEQQIKTEAYRAPALALAAVALTASVYLLRLPPVAFFAQFYLVAAFLHWIGAYGWATPTPHLPIWNPLVLLGSTLALGHWQQAQRRQPEPSVAPINTRDFFAVVHAVILCMLLWLWLQPQFSLLHWTALACLISLGLLAYGMATGYRLLAAVGQWLLAVGIAASLQVWAKDATEGSGERWLTLAPILAVLMTLAAGRRFLTPEASKMAGSALTRVSAVYELSALLLFILWVGRYFPHWQQFAVFAASGAVIFTVSCVRREARWLWWSAALNLVGLLVFWLGCRGEERGDWIQLLGIVALAAQQQFGRRWAWKPPAFTPRAEVVVMILATLCAWVWVSARLTHGASGSGFTLAAGWSLFAAVVFAVGLGLRERIYRWMGLVVLACTLGHIAIIDIWQLGSLERFLSALALTLVLLAISFIYTRYQSKLKEWF